MKAPMSYYGIGVRRALAEVGQMENLRPKRVVDRR